MTLIILIVALVGIILGFVGARVFDSRFDKLQGNLISHITNETANVQKNVIAEVQKVKGVIRT